MLGLLAVLFAGCAWWYATVRAAGDEPEAGRWIKLVPMTVLAGVLLLPILSAAGAVPWQLWAALFAVVASWIGDHRLASDGDAALQQGMVAFALAHVAYLCVLFGAGGVPPLVAIIAFALLALSTRWWLLPHTGALRLPVMGYVAVISLMGLGASAAALAAGGSGAMLVAVGAGLFILSDTVLSLQLFRWQSESRAVALAVLLPYFWGQLALVAGILQIAG